MGAVSIYFPFLLLDVVFFQTRPDRAKNITKNTAVQYRQQSIPPRVWGTKKWRNKSRFADTGKKCDLELFCSESSGLFFVLLFLFPTRHKKLSVGLFYAFLSERLREEEIPIGEIVATIQPFPLQVWILDGESNSPFRRCRKERSNSALATFLCRPSVTIDVFSIA